MIDEKTIEEIYEYLDQLMGDVSNISNQLIEIREYLKPHLSREFFEPKQQPPPPTEQE